MKRKQPQAKNRLSKKMEPDDDSAALPRVHTLQSGAPLCEYLKHCVGVVSPPDVSLEQLLEDTREFPRPFPVQSVRCSEILKAGDVTRAELQHHVNSAYPLLHESALPLFVNFLVHKKLNGTALEKVVYTNMGIVDLAQRFLDKRAVSFFGKQDNYLLLNGKTGKGGWETVGKNFNKEKAPLVLVNCLSYEEMKLSAFLSVSSHSVFVNDGNRNNRGEVAPPGDIQRQGVVIGLIGTRLSRPDFMEWQEVMVTKSQNVAGNGYGPSSAPGLASLSQQIAYSWRQIWSQFYGVSPHLPLYEDVEKKVGEKVKPEETRYVQLPKDVGIFDNQIFKKRVSASIETLLLEAETRAVEKNTTAYVYVVGIGLGLWKVSKHQERVFLAAFAECVRRLQDRLTHVSDLHFGWFGESNCGGVSNGGKFESGIRVAFSKSPPHKKLPGADDGKLLVVSYAWDSNAFPGNEFWLGKLASSGDSAAACSTQITELHNPVINSNRVCGSNLHVASPQWGVLHIADYARKKLAERHQE
ncbi:uncharacterized protein LOC134540404 [Bacillus rossius redtenbacheri]|uniref:uncharacterized protein LOC134540404 n=1 Tax=Bacillus rossius redtenbacheri TaxID=93214 RepID=UPI002FDD7F2B